MNKNYYPMTPEERKRIIERNWSYDEAFAAKECVKSLEEHGEWKDRPPTKAMHELAEAVCSHPASCISIIQGKIVDAFDRKIRKL